MCFTNYTQDKLDYLNDQVRALHMLRYGERPEKLIRIYFSFKAVEIIRQYPGDRRHKLT